MFSRKSNKLIIFYLILGLCAGLLGPVLAENYDFIGLNDPLVVDNNSNSLSMSDAIKIAIVNNPKVIIERASIDEKLFSVDESKSYLYPQIYVKQDFIASNNPVQAFMIKLSQRNFNLGTANLNYPDSKANFSTRIGAKLTLIDRKIYSDIDIKKAELELQKQIGKAAIYDLVKDVRKAFLDVLFAKERVQNAQYNINYANAHLNAVSQKKDVGMASKSDYLGAKVLLSNANEALVKSKNDLNLAWITFADLLGDDNVVGLDLDDSMRDDYSVESVDKLVKYSYLHRPEILEVEILKEKSVKDLTLAKRTGSMTLDVMGEWGVDTILDDRDIARSYTAGVFLNKSIFDGGLRRAKIKKAKAGIEKSDAKIDEAYKQIKLEVVQSYLSTVNSKERLNMTNDLVNDAEESLRAYNERFAVGLSNAVEVENAQSKLSDARLLRAHSLYDFKLAVISLQRALGMSLDDILSGKGLLITGNSSSDLKNETEIKKDNGSSNSFMPEKLPKNKIDTGKTDSQKEHSFLDSPEDVIQPDADSSGSFLNDSKNPPLPSSKLMNIPEDKEIQVDVIEEKPQSEHSFLDDSTINLEYDVNEGTSFLNQPQKEDKEVIIQQEEPEKNKVIDIEPSKMQEKQQSEYSFLDDSNIDLENEEGTSFLNQPQEVEEEVIMEQQEPQQEEKVDSDVPEEKEIQQEYSFLDDKDAASGNEVIEITPDLRMVKVRK
ncbi:MAG: TolC family protein [Vampirovibrionia bacterium]